MVKKVIDDNVGGPEFGHLIYKYYGMGEALYPEGDISRLVSSVGEVEAKSTEKSIKEVVCYMQGLHPDWSAYTLTTVGDWVRGEMCLRYPRLDSKALDALVWVFTWWWK